MKYTYIITDDEQEWRERAIETINEFNENKAEQDRFLRTYNEKIELELIGSFSDFGVETNAAIARADLVFLDLRFGEFEAGRDLLQLANNAIRKKFVVLSSYKEDLIKNQAQYPQVIGWLHKPLRIGNLEDIVDKFHIDRNDIRAVFTEDYVTIIAQNLRIFYDKIDYIKTGGGEVRITMLDGNRHIFVANVFPLTNFDNRGNLRRISTSCAINIGHKNNQNYTWQIAHDRNSGLYAKHQENKNLIVNEFRITKNFEEIVQIMNERA